ncbi:hypothetical protein [Azoarcus sp. DN11]|nr:hypothetical protein [Azoarcus sp. DN11]
MINAKALAVKTASAVFVADCRKAADDFLLVRADYGPGQAPTACL